jgi:ATP-binding cassette subfamily B protein
LGIRIVKSFTNEDVEKEKFNEGAKKYLKIKRNNYVQMGTFHTIVRIFDGTMYILVVAAGAVL